MLSTFQLALVVCVPGAMSGTELRKHKLWGVFIQPLDLTTGSETELADQLAHWGFEAFVDVNNFAVPY